MEPIEAVEVKRLLLEMLERFTQLCENQGLHYFLDYGTLLGAVRHGGFIPWDDDVDVMMPRWDYERLYQLFAEKPELLGDEYRLSSYRNAWSSQKSLLTLVDLRTITKSPNRKKRFYYPLWVDIFPADYMPETEEEQRRLRWKVAKLTKKVQLSVCPGYGKIKLLRELSSRMQLPLMAGRLEEIDRLCRSNAPSEMLGSYMAYSSTIKMEDCFPAAWFEDTIFIPFEGKLFRAPRDYDKRLRDYYGDYMQPPPENERVPHFTNAYWVEGLGEKKEWTRG